MRVRMITTMAGPSGNAGPGEIIDVARDFAYALIESGAAEQVDDGPAAPAAPETTALDTPETAVMPAAKIRKRR